MPRTAFIACSKTKRNAPCTAKQMYQGALFKKALTYCERHFEQVYILSAKYGLVSLTQIISPYEQTLNAMSKLEREAWGRKVAAQLQQAGLFDSNELWFFTGARYHEFFDGHKPLAGLSLGYQLKWFADRLTQKEKTGGFGL